MTDSLSIALHAFANGVLMSFKTDRHCFLGRRTCPQVSKDHAFVCEDVASEIPARVLCFVYVDMEAYTYSCSFQTMLHVFGLSGSICCKRYAIGVVCSDVFL